MSKTPQNLIETEVPDHFATIKNDLSEDQKSVLMKIGVSITGDGGGEWTLTFENGELSVVGGSIADDFNLAVTASIDSFNAAINDRPEINAFDPGKADLSLLKPELADRLAQITGTLKTALLDLTEELMSVTVQFGSAAPKEPTCEILVQEQDAKDMAAGKLNPQQAFMGGKIQINGDMALAMQLSTLAM